MFYFFSGYAYIMIAAAVIPAICLIKYVYKMDSLEKEPPMMIFGLVVAGVVSAFLAMALERLGGVILSILNIKNGLIFGFVEFFLIVGPAEEISKYVMLKRNSWNNREFNCQFDAVVYAVSVSLGFALLENIIYVFNYGLSVALIRAITAIPGHACFGVFMGVWYGVAKKKEFDGEFSQSAFFRKLAVIVPAVIHGCYDFIATISGGFLSELFFVVFVAAMFYVSFKTIKALSERDRYM